MKIVTWPNQVYLLRLHCNRDENELTARHHWSIQDKMSRRGAVRRVVNGSMKNPNRNSEDRQLTAEELLITRDQGTGQWKTRLTTFKQQPGLGLICFIIGMATGLCMSSTAMFLNAQPTMVLSDSMSRAGANMSTTATVETAQQNTKEKDGQYWNQIGQAAYSRGRFYDAARAFALATRQSGFGGALWSNFGIVLTDLGMQQAAADFGPTAKEIIPLLCEAAAAIELGAALGGSDPETAGLEVVKVELRKLDFENLVARGDNPIQACEIEAGERYRFARIAIAQVQSLDHIAAVNTLCVDNSTHMTVTAMQRTEITRQALMNSATSAFEAYALFRVVSLKLYRHSVRTAGSTSL